MRMKSLPEEELCNSTFWLEDPYVIYIPADL